VLLGIPACNGTPDPDSPANKKRTSEHLGDLVLRARANPDDPVPLREMVAALNGKWTFGRAAACRALLELGPQAQSATPDLMRALDSHDFFVSREAARALGAVSQGLPDAVGPLTEKLTLTHLDVSGFAAEALGNIGEPAVVAIPKLEVAAGSQSEQLSTAARQALAKLRAIEAKRPRTTSPGQMKGQKKTSGTKDE
jgi:HEAT repeat protein